MAQKLIILFFLLLSTTFTNAQRTLQYNPSKHSIKNHPQILEVNVITDFGAKPNDATNDTRAFNAAADFINERGGRVKLIIPKGQYIIGEQVHQKDNTYYYVGRNIIGLNGVDQVQIQGQNGAVLKFDVGFKFGSFDTRTGSSTNNSWDCSVKKRNVSGQRATLGSVIDLYDCSNVTVSNLVLDGNFYPNTLNNMNSFDVRGVTNKNSRYQSNKINLGGAFGDCSIQLIHTGVRIVRSGNIEVRNVTSKRFGLDGIYIANEDNNPNQKNVVIQDCEIDYNARTGIAITGGNDIRIINNRIQNTGRLVFTATGTGIDIEAQGKSRSSVIKVKNLLIQGNHFFRNTSGEIINLYGNGSDQVQIVNNTFEDVTRALHLNTSKNTNYTIENNTFNGRRRIFINNKQTSPTQLNSKKIKNIRSNKNK